MKMPETRTVGKKINRRPVCESCGKKIEYSLFSNENGKSFLLEEPCECTYLSKLTFRKLTGGDAFSARTGEFYESVPNESALHPDFTRRQLEK